MDCIVIENDAFAQYSLLIDSVLAGMCVVLAEHAKNAERNSSVFRSRLKNVLQTFDNLTSCRVRHVERTGKKRAMTWPPSTYAQFLMVGHTHARVVQRCPCGIATAMERTWYGIMWCVEIMAPCEYLRPAFKRSSFWPRVGF